MTFLCDLDPTRLASVPQHVKDEYLALVMTPGSLSDEDYERMLDLGEQIRSALTPPPRRTRAEVDRDIAEFCRAQVRMCGRLNVNWETVNTLCAEPVRDDDPAQDERLLDVLRQALDMAPDASEATVLARVCKLRQGPQPERMPHRDVQLREWCERHKCSWEKAEIAMKAAFEMGAASVRERMTEALDAAYHEVNRLRLVMCEIRGGSWNREEVNEILDTALAVPAPNSPEADGTARGRSQQELSRLRAALDTDQERIVKLQGALAAAQEALGDIRRLDTDHEKGHIDTSQYLSSVRRTLRGVGA